jgi:hypothetical protein
MLSTPLQLPQLNCRIKPIICTWVTPLQLGNLRNLYPDTKQAGVVVKLDICIQEVPGSNASQVTGSGCIQMEIAELVFYILWEQKLG